MTAIPSDLERFINPYGENVQEFRDNYGAYLTPPKDSSTIKTEKKYG